MARACEPWRGVRAPRGPPAIHPQNPPPQQATSILVVPGGTLAAGSAAAPFPGRATVTLHGGPGDAGLPLFGAKALAARGGQVLLRGRPKVPAWTRLNATALEGATEVFVCGEVNWVPGARFGCALGPMQVGRGAGGSMCGTPAGG
jgi:hypothetical protein